MHTYKLLRAAVLAFIVFGLAGCHAHDPMMRAKMQATIEAIEGKADEAHSLAQQANNLATRAEASAQEAQDAADEAMSCCRSNATKMDRMFEETMMK